MMDKDPLESAVASERSSRRSVEELVGDMIEGQITRVQTWPEPDFEVDRLYSRFIEARGKRGDRSSEDLIDLMLEEERQDREVNSDLRSLPIEPEPEVELSGLEIYGAFDDDDDDPFDTPDESEAVESGPSDAANSAQDVSSMMPDEESAKEPDKESVDRQPAPVVVEPKPEGIKASVLSFKIERHPVRPFPVNKVPGALAPRAGIPTTSSGSVDSSPTGFPSVGDQDVGQELDLLALTLEDIPPWIDPENPTPEDRAEIAAILYRRLQEGFIKEGSDASGPASAIPAQVGVTAPIPDQDGREGGYPSSSFPSGAITPTRAPPMPHEPEVPIGGDGVEGASLSTLYICPGESGEIGTSAGLPPAGALAPAVLPAPLTSETPIEAEGADRDTSYRLDFDAASAPRIRVLPPGAFPEPVTTPSLPESEMPTDRVGSEGAGTPTLYIAPQAPSEMTGLGIRTAFAGAGEGPTISGVAQASGLPIDGEGTDGSADADATTLYQPALIRTRGPNLCARWT